MDDLEVFVGTHGATAVVFFLTDDVDFTDVKGVCRADDGTDVKIVFDVFDGNFEAGAFFTQHIKNLLVREAFVLVDEIARVVRFTGGIHGLILYHIFKTGPNLGIMKERRR